MNRANVVYIRTFQLQEYDQVVALWQVCGLHLSRSDTPAGIERKLERDADLFLIASDGSEIVGAVMGCYDGRRGWVNHLAVAPAYRASGVGRQLMDELAQRLLARGCDKMNLLVEPTNASVQGFYEKLGYQPKNLIFLEKWLS